MWFVILKRTNHKHMENVFAKSESMSKWLPFVDWCNYNLKLKFHINVYIWEQRTIKIYSRIQTLSFEFRPYSDDIALLLRDQSSEIKPMLKKQRKNSATENDRKIVNRKKEKNRKIHPNPTRFVYAFGLLI